MTMITLHDITDVGYDVYACCVSQGIIKAETDNWRLWFGSKFTGVRVTKIIKQSFVWRSYCRNKMVQFLLTHSVELGHIPESQIKCSYLQGIWNIRAIPQISYKTA